MARQLEMLKHRKSEDNRSRSTVSPSVAGASDHSLGDCVPSDAKPLFDDGYLQLEEFRLGSFEIDAETVLDVFRMYANHFHPHFPILEPTISVALLHQTSPLLFWTIIATILARRIKPGHGELYSRLSNPYMAQLRVDVLAAPLPLPTLQALLVLITFPFPSERQTREPSWLYCGLAVNAALYMGLQKPTPIKSLRSIGVVPGAIRARANTWLGCFLASTSLSLFVGLSPLINSSTDLDTVDKFAHEQSLPKEHVYQIMVQHTLAKYTSVLLNDSRAVVSLAIVQLIDNELDALKTKYAPDFTARMEYSVLVAKLHLYAMTVIRMQSDRTSRNIILQLGLSVSLRIVYLIEQGLAYPSTVDLGIPADLLPLTMPKNYFRGLVLASIFLLRYFALNSQATAEEQELARNHVSLAHTYFKSVTREPDDEQDRGARLLASLSRQQPIDIDNIKPIVNDRLGASLVYDAITTGHELRNDNVEAEDTTPVTVSESPSGSGSGSAGIEEAAAPATAPFNDSNIVVPEFAPDPMEGLGPLDLTLPADLWGDSMWGMFDFNTAPYNTWDGQ